MRSGRYEFNLAMHNSSICMGRVCSVTNTQHGLHEELVQWKAAATLVLY